MQPAPRIRVRRRVLYSALVGLPLALAALLAAEVCVRARGTYIARHTSTSDTGASPIITLTSRGGRLIPNTHVTIRNHGVSGRDVRIDINSMGFRDDEIPRRKPEGEIRVLALGDSITFGDYLQAEEVWVERAERYLGDRLAPRSVEVIDASLGAIGLEEEIDILVEQGLAIEPDWVIVAFYTNDSRPAWGLHREPGHPGWLRRHSLIVQKLHERLEVHGWVKAQGMERFRWVGLMRSLDWAHSREQFRELVDSARDDWGAAWQEESWGLIDGHLSRLASLSREHGFRVALVAFPVVFQVQAKFVDDLPQKTLEHRARAFGFHFLDLLPSLRDEASRSKGLFFDQCHPRVEANDLIGRLVASFLAQQILPASDLGEPDPG